MVGYVYERNSAVWTKDVNKPRKYLKHQVIFHNQWSYPFIYASFNNKKDAEKLTRKLIKKIKKQERKDKIKQRELIKKIKS